MAIKEKTTISLDAQTKRDGIAILDAMGLNLSTFAEMSLRQLVRDGRLPFMPSVKYGDAVTLGLRIQTDRGLLFDSHHYSL